MLVVSVHTGHSYRVDSSRMEAVWTGDFQNVHATRYVHGYSVHKLLKFALGGVA